MGTTNEVVPSWIFTAYPGPKNKKMQAIDIFIGPLSRCFLTEAAGMMTLKKKNCKVLMIPSFVPLTKKDPRHLAPQVQLAIMHAALRSAVRPFTSGLLSEWRLRNSVRSVHLSQEFSLHPLASG